MSTLPTRAYPDQLISAAAGTASLAMGLMLVGTGSVYELDRAEAWRHYVQPRVALVFEKADNSTGTVERPDVRTPLEHLENIRTVLDPPVADLAGLFGVSRQAIYKWLAKDSTPEPDKVARITALSHIADAFRDAGISRAGSLLKMKAFAGRSLMDLLKSGENCTEQASVLITEAKLMEASYDRSGLALSKAKPTTDWQSSISIPAYPEDS